MFPPLVRTLMTRIALASSSLHRSRQEQGDRVCIRDLEHLKRWSHQEATKVAGSSPRRTSAHTTGPRCVCAFPESASIDGRNNSIMASILMCSGVAVTLGNSAPLFRATAPTLGQTIQPSPHRAAKHVVLLAYYRSCVTQLFGPSHKHRSVQPECFSLHP